MKFLQILQTKPHNKHYLNRYIKFINYCISNNNLIETYTEIHHICPKSKDLFPEYSNLKLHSWNKCILTARQHFIAHWILTKTFETKATHDAFWMMVHVKSKTQLRYTKINSKLYENLKKLRSNYISTQMTTNNPSKLPSVKEKRKLQLLGNSYGKVNKGQKRTEQQKLNMSIAQKGNKSSTEKHKTTVINSNKKRKGTNPTKIAVEKVKIKCYCEGVIYNSIKEANDAYPGISVQRRLKDPKYTEFYKLK